MKIDFEQVTKTRENLRRIAAMLLKAGCPSITDKEVNVRLDKSGAGGAEFFIDSTPISGWTASQVISFALVVDRFVTDALAIRDALAVNVGSALTISTDTLEQLAEQEGNK